MPRIIEVHRDLRVGDDVEVVVGEILRYDARHQRLDLGDRFALHAWIHRDGAGGDARATPDDEHPSWIVRDECREMSQHALQAHVLRFTRRLHLACVVVVEDARRRARHCHGCGHPFACVDDLVYADPGGGISAVRHENAWQRRHRAYQQACCGADDDHGDHTG